MATVLYKLVDKEVVTEICNPLEVDSLLKSGYAVSPDKLKKKAKPKSKPKSAGE